MLKVAGVEFCEFVEARVVRKGEKLINLLWYNLIILKVKNMAEDLEVISVKVTKQLAQMIKQYMELDTHVTLSDFVRDAIRDKIKTDAPWLYEKMLKKNTGA
jgi:hypothetical protein